MENRTDYTLVKKTELAKININAFKSSLPDLKNSEEAKSIVIGTWLAERIKNGIKTGEFKISGVLPSKSEFAYLLGVSIGTMQHALRYLEDLGFVESKQCIGTMIKDYTKPSSLRKLTSKRDLAIAEIKRYILNGGFKTGSEL